MATQKITLNDNEWTLVLVGAGIVQLVKHNQIRVFIGTAAPAVNTDVYHSVSFSGDTDIDYTGTENIYCRAGFTGSVVDVIATVLR